MMALSLLLLECRPALVAGRGGSLWRTAYFVRAPLNQLNSNHQTLLREDEALWQRFVRSYRSLHRFQTLHLLTSLCCSLMRTMFQGDIEEPDDAGADDAPPLNQLQLL